MGTDDPAAGGAGNIEWRELIVRKFGANEELEIFIWDGRIDLLDVWLEPRYGQSGVLSKGVVRYLPFKPVGLSLGVSPSPDWDPSVRMPADGALWKCLLACAIWMWFCVSSWMGWLELTAQWHGRRHTGSTDHNVCKKNPCGGVTYNIILVSGCM